MQHTRNLLVPRRQNVPDNKQHVCQLCHSSMCMCMYMCRVAPAYDAACVCVCICAEWHLHMMQHGHVYVYMQSHLHMVQHVCTEGMQLLLQSTDEVL